MTSAKEKAIAKTAEYLERELVPEQRHSESRADLKQQQIDNYTSLQEHLSLQGTCAEGMVSFQCGLAVPVDITSPTEFIRALPMANQLVQLPDLYVELTDKDLGTFLTSLLPILQRGFKISREKSLALSIRIQKINVLLEDLATL